jgi:alanine dehydrogenase
MPLLVDYAEKAWSPLRATRVWASVEPGPQRIGWRNTTVISMTTPLNSAAVQSCRTLGGVLVLIASDSDVLRVPAIDAVEIMRAAVLAHADGRLEAPTRFGVELGAGRFTLTAGRLAGAASGFRLGTSVDAQSGELTLVFDASGLPLGIVFGREVGRRRTGALGGVAADVLARPESSVLGLIGAGEQAFTQLWAIAAVRQLRRVRVFSRQADRREAFAARARAELDLDVEVVDEAHLALVDADILVMATPSEVPLIDVSWIPPGCHVHTLGPKGPPEGECPRELAATAAVLVSDSPAQLAAMEGAGAPWTRGRAVVSLGEVAAGTSTGRVSPDDVTCYASVGLAATEVLLARRVLELVGIG